MRNQTTNQTQKPTTFRPARAVLCLLLALFLLGGTCTAYAADDPPAITPFYVNIRTNVAKLSISGIKATCTATLKADKSMKLTIKMDLQKLKSGAYETIKTWTGSKTGTYFSMTESRNINIFCDYRLKVTFTAGSETVTAYRYPA